MTSLWKFEPERSHSSPPCYLWNLRLPFWAISVKPRWCETARASRAWVIKESGMQPLTQSTTRCLQGDDWHRILIRTIWPSKLAGWWSKGRGSNIFAQAPIAITVLSPAAVISLGLTAQMRHCRNEHYSAQIACYLECWRFGTRHWTLCFWMAKICPQSASWASSK